MSAGKLVVVKYEMFSGTGGSSANRCQIYVQPETLGAQFSGGPNLAGTVGGGPNNQYRFAIQVARSVSSRTVRARCIRIQWTTPPDGFSSKTQLLIPVPRISVFNGTGIGTDGEYLGGLFTVVSKHSWGL